MTTVAYKAGIIACDSCWTYGGTVDTLSTKIQRLSSGALVGMAGQNDARALIALIDKVKTPAQIPSFEALMALRSDSLVLLVLPGGRIFKIATLLQSIDHAAGGLDDIGDLGAWEVQSEFSAIGSGAELATGAMRCGAPAEDAVNVACEFDPNSRLPVHVLPLNPPNQKVKNGTRHNGKRI